MSKCVAESVRAFPHDVNRGKLDLKKFQFSEAECDWVYKYLAPRVKEYPEVADGYEVYSPPIGKGAFAKVYQAKVKQTGKMVAIKILPLEDVPNLEDLRAEVMTMRQLHHPNVVGVHTAFDVDDALWIVLPLLRGALIDVLKAAYPTGIKDETILATLLRGCLLGLQYLHKNFLIHRDIKAGNILLTNEGEVQLADFGVAGKMVEGGDHAQKRRTFTGTPCWMAPEVMERTTGYDCKADIWSFGILALELAFGYAPYAKFLPMKVLLLTLQNDPPGVDSYEDKSKKFDRSFSDMLKHCLVKEPKDRSSAETLLKHKFFNFAGSPALIQKFLLVHLPPRPIGSVMDFKANEKDKRKAESWVFDVADLIKVRTGEASSIVPVHHSPPQFVSPPTTAARAPGPPEPLAIRRLSESKSAPPAPVARSNPPGPPRPATLTTGAIEKSPSRFVVDENLDSPTNSPRPRRSTTGSRFEVTDSPATGKPA